MVAENRIDPVAAADRCEGSHVFAAQFTGVRVYDVSTVDYQVGFQGVDLFGHTPDQRVVRSVVARMQVGKHHDSVPVEGSRQFIRRDRDLFDFDMIAPTRGPVNHDAEAVQPDDQSDSGKPMHAPFFHPAGRVIKQGKEQVYQFRDDRHHKDGDNPQDDLYVAGRGCIGRHPVAGQGDDDQCVEEKERSQINPVYPGPFRKSFFQTVPDQQILQDGDQSEQENKDFNHGAT